MLPFGGLGKMALGGLVDMVPLIAGQAPCVHVWTCGEKLSALFHLLIISWFKFKFFSRKIIIILHHYQALKGVAKEPHY